ncbi:MAG: type 1 glutamine amidotransferase [Nocardioidaceae bacterium]
MPDTDPLLVIQHQDNCPPALFAQWLRTSRLDLDVRRPDRGDALPTDLSAHSGLLVLGGSMGAHDDATYPWLPLTRGLLLHAIEAGRPTLGICLGHQLACVALGAQSRPSPRGQTVGARPIGWRAGAVDDPLCRDLFADPDALVPHWNTDVVLELPDGVALLAATADGATQVVRLGTLAWGVQFHPEVDHALVCEWAEEDRVAQQESGAGSGADLDDGLQQLKDNEQELLRTGRMFAESFARIVREERR